MAPESSARSFPRRLCVCIAIVPRNMLATHDKPVVAYRVGKKHGVSDLRRVISVRVKVERVKLRSPARHSRHFANTIVQSLALTERFPGFVNAFC